MTHRTSRGTYRAVLLLAGAAALALVVAGLVLGPSTVSEYPGLVWALLLVPALVFTITSQLPGPSVLLAVGVVAAGLLELLQPVSPEVRWWAAGATSTLLVSIALLMFWKRGAPSTPTREPAVDQEVEASDSDAVFRQPLVDLFLHKQVAAARRGEELTVVLLRLDDFPEFREQNGEDLAQQLLARTERSLRAAVRDSDVVGRYGEADFLALLLGEGRRGAFLFANRIQRKLSRLALKGQDGSVVNSGVTLSAGLATFRDDMETPSDLVEEARRAVDAAREQGGNRILVARDVSGE